MATRDRILSINLNKGMDTKTDDRLEAECDLIQNATIDRTGTPRKRNGFELLHDVGEPVRSVSDFYGSVYSFGTLKTFKNGKFFANYTQAKQTINRDYPDPSLYTDFVVYLDSGSYIKSGRGSTIFDLYNSDGESKGSIANGSGKIFKVGNKCALVTIEATKLTIIIINDDANLTYSSFDIINPILPDAITDFSEFVSNTTEFFLSVSLFNGTTGKVFVYKLKTSGTILDSNLAYSYASMNYPLQAVKCLVASSRLLVGIYTSKTGVNEKIFHVLDYNSAVLSTAPTDREYIANWTATERYDEFCGRITASEISGVVRWFFTTTRNGFDAGVVIPDIQKHKSFLGEYSYKFDYNVATPQATLSALRTFFPSWYIGRMYLIASEAFVFQGKHSVFFQNQGPLFLYIDTDFYTRTKSEIESFGKSGSGVIYDFYGKAIYSPSVIDTYKVSFRSLELDFNTTKITQPFIYNGYLIVPSTLIKIITQDGQLLTPDSLTMPFPYDVQNDTGGSLPAGNYSVALQIANGPLSQYKNLTIAGNAISFNALSVDGQAINVFLESEDVIYDSIESVTNYDSPDDLGVRFKTYKVINFGIEAQYTFEDIEKNLWPAMSCMTIWKNRIVGVNDSELNKIWYSSVSEEDLTSTPTIEAVPFFSGFFSLKINDIRADNTGVLTCVEVLDDKLLMFKGSSVFMTFGEGPNNVGLVEQSFTEPQLINSEVGCVEPRSLITTSYGLYFKSYKGIYLMGRSLQFEYAGKEMEAYNDLEITGATSFEKKNLVIFTTKTGAAMVWDTSTLKWSVFTNFICNASNLILGEITFAKNDGKIYKMNSSFSDAGEFIPMKISLGWIRLAEPAIQNFQRVKRFILLGKWKSKHKLRFSMSYDYEEYTEEAVTYTPNGTYNVSSRPTNEGLYNGTNNGVYQVEHVLKKQKCQALKVTIEDVKDGTIGESLELTNLSLIIGTKTGLNKINSYKKV